MKEFRNFTVVHDSDWKVLCFMITGLFYIVLLIHPFGCKNPINDDDDDDDGECQCLHGASSESTQTLIVLFRQYEPT